MCQIYTSKHLSSQASVKDIYTHLHEQYSKSLFVHFASLQDHLLTMNQLCISNISIPPQTLAQKYLPPQTMDWEAADPYKFLEFRALARFLLEDQIISKKTSTAIYNTSRDPKALKLGNPYSGKTMQTKMMQPKYLTNLTAISKLPTHNGVITKKVTAYKGRRQDS